MTPVTLGLLNDLGFTVDYNSVYVRSTGLSLVYSSADVLYPEPEPVAEPEPEPEPVAEPEPESEPENEDIIYSSLDTTNLKMEYIATSEYANSSTWTPTYNAYTGTTTIPSGITYDSTSGSYLFADTGSNPSGIEPPYENGTGTYTYGLASNNGFCLLYTSPSPRD